MRGRYYGGRCQSILWEPTYLDKELCAKVYYGSHATCPRERGTPADFERGTREERRGAEAVGWTEGPAKILCIQSAFFIHIARDGCSDRGMKSKYKA